MHPGSSGAILPAPTGDVNLPLALVAFVIIWVHIESLRARGFTGYFKHYFKPFAALAPINVIEEITKPITMTFRLFGNIFSGGLFVVVLLTLLPVYVTWPFEIAWKFFDTGLLGTIQAFIFMLLDDPVLRVCDEPRRRRTPRFSIRDVSLRKPRRK